MPFAQIPPGPGWYCGDIPAPSPSPASRMRIHGIELNAFWISRLTAAPNWRSFIADAVSFFSLLATWILLGIVLYYKKLYGRKFWWNLRNFAKIMEDLREILIIWIFHKNFRNQKTKCWKCQENFVDILKILGKVSRNSYENSIKIEGKFWRFFWEILGSFSINIIRHWSKFWGKFEEIKDILKFFFLVEEGLLEKRREFSHGVKKYILFLDRIFTTCPWNILIWWKSYIRVLSDLRMKELHENEISMIGFPPCFHPSSLLLPGVINNDPYLSFALVHHMSIFAHRDVTSGGGGEPQIQCYPLSEKMTLKIFFKYNNYSY